jgi:putative NADH-flavin reductase
MNKNIAVIGATGMVGQPVAVELMRAGFTVTALVRNHSNEKKLPGEIRLVRGDIKNAGDLLTLLHGQDFLYINLNLKPEEKKSDWHSESDGLKNIIAAAQQAKIKRIAFISSLVMRYQGINNFDWWVFDLKKQAIDLIRSSGIPYTIFYPSAFMENFHSNYRQGNKIMLAGESKAKMYFISAVDYGKQVAMSFQNLTATNKEYDVQGLEAFTSEEASYEFVNHHKKETLKISKAPLGVLKFIGLFSQKMNYVSNIIEALNNYPEKFAADTTWNELGKPSITLRDFAATKG